MPPALNPRGGIGHVFLKSQIFLITTATGLATVVKRDGGKAQRGAGRVKEFPSAARAAS